MGQSRMDNPETPTTFSTQDTGRRLTKQKTKKMSKKPGGNPDLCSRKVKAVPINS